MTAPLVLQVPAPSASYKAIGGLAPMEQAVALAFDAVRFPDGSAMIPDEYVGADALLSRVAIPGGTAEVWDPDQKLWRPETTVELKVLKGLPVMPPKSPAESWQALLIGSVEKDANGQPQIGPAISGFPQYRVRGSFRARRGAVQAGGIGPEGPPLQFASVPANSRLGVELTPDADSANRVQILLRDGATRPLGVIDIDASGAGPVVTISNRGLFGVLASVRLEVDGSISLLPAAGKGVTVGGSLAVNGNVVVNGNLDVNLVHYLPFGSFVKVDLP